MKTIREAIKRLQYRFRANKIRRTIAKPGYISDAYDSILHETEISMDEFNSLPQIQKDLIRIISIRKNVANGKVVVAADLRTIPYNAIMDVIRHSSCNKNDKEELFGYIFNKADKSDDEKLTWSK